MYCPHCNGAIPDTSAICPLCDAILNPAFLDSSTEPGAEARQSSPYYPAPPLGDSAPPLAPPQGSYGGEAPDLGGHTEGTSILQLDPERQKETRIVKVSDLAASRRSPMAPGRGAGHAAATPAEEAAAGDLWAQVHLAYRRLRPLEKVTFFGLVALLVCAFLPWFHVRGEGFVSGIEGKGALSATLTFLALVVFWVRVTYRWILLVLGQVFLVAGAGLMAGLAYKTAAAATPTFGLFLTLLTAAGAAVVSLVAVVK